MKLKEFWQSSYNADVHKQLWDEAAKGYLNKPIPALKDHSFLSMIDHCGVLDNQTSILDIGCGAGTLTMALAPYVKQAVGCDLSQKMIHGAVAKAAELGLINTNFYCLNWHAIALEDLGWEKAFDVVFAHQTPAIGSYDTFDKMVRCAKKACFFRMNTRRYDAVQSQVFEQLGISSADKDKDRNIPLAFAYLWEHGLEPHVSYHQEVWHPIKKLEEQITWIQTRAKLYKSLTAQDEKTIAHYLSGIAKNGMVQETITTTIVTMDWKMQ